MLSFDQLIRSVLRRLPRRVANLVLFHLAVFSWISAPVNFLSQIAHIGVVVEFWRTALERAVALRPALEAAWVTVEPAIALWRSVLAPIRDWLAATLAVSVPNYVVHTMLMLILCAPALARYGIARAALSHRKSELRKALQVAFEDRAVAENFRNRKDTYRETNAIIADVFANGGPTVSQLDGLDQRFEARRRHWAAKAVLLWRRADGPDSKVQGILTATGALRRDLRTLQGSAIFLAFVAILAVLGISLVLVDAVLST